MGGALKIKRINLTKSTFVRAKIFSIVLLALILVTSLTFEYRIEKDQTLKGRAEFELNYRFQLTNLGPLNLSSLNIRLAMLKTWEPVQVVNNFISYINPNRTSTDEYENEFAWYEFDTFEKGRYLDLSFDTNLTVNILDYSAASIKQKNYDVNSPEYKLFTVYHPLTDTTDPGIQDVAQGLTSSENPIDIAFEAYNFSSQYLNYRLLSTEKGASYALRNAYGDCDEYTSLFIALVKSRGIPAIEHTAWLADFNEGFVTTDEGAVAHAYPMFYVEGVGMLPTDPTRGHQNLFDNWLRTDEKTITMTRGPNQPYRKLVYRWVPVEGMDDPLVQSNYTISIKKLNIEYYSVLRQILLSIITGLPIFFIIFTTLKTRSSMHDNQRKREKILSPTWKRLNGEDS